MSVEKQDQGAAGNLSQSAAAEQKCGAAAGQKGRNDMRAMDGAARKRKMKTVHVWLRFGIQAVCFILFPAAFTEAFSGIRYIFAQIGAGSRIELNSFVAALLVLCVYTVVFGRFFCGFACAFGSLGDWVHAVFAWVCRKLKKKPARFPRKLTAALSRVKYGVLAVLVLFSFLGVISSLHGASPWEVFSLFAAGNFDLSGHAAGIVILIAILIGMCMQERFFCRFLCPLGALFSVLPVLPFFSLRRKRENCIPNCRACTSGCPSEIELSGQSSWKNADDCFQCQKCADACPRGNVGTGIRGLAGNEAVFTAVRAGLLVVLFLIVGI